jgi:hypothetical protein
MQTLLRSSTQNATTSLGHHTNTNFYENTYSNNEKQKSNNNEKNYMRNEGGRSFPPGN